MRAVENVHTRSLKCFVNELRDESGERSALQINANDILFRLSVRLGWFFFLIKMIMCFVQKATEMVGSRAAEKRLLGVCVCG